MFEAEPSTIQQDSAIHRNTDEPNLPPAFHTVKIHAALAELPNAIRLWYALRWLDTNGSGQVRTTYQEIATILDCSVPTVKRYFRQGVQMSLYRSVIKERKRETITVYLFSLFAVCKRYGFTDWGATTDIFANELNVLRLIATQATAQRVQRHSRYLAKKEHGIVAHPAKIFGASSCKAKGRKRQKKINGSVLRREDRFMFVSADYASYGSSQEHIAGKLDRSDRTVRRRLSNSHRDKKGLPHLDRVQLLKLNGTVPDKATFDQMIAHGYDQIMGFSSKKGGIDIWSLLPNIYSEDLKLFSQRQLRNKYAKLLKRAQEQNQIQGQIQTQQSEQIASVTSIHERSAHAHSQGHACLNAGIPFEPECQTGALLSL